MDMTITFTFGDLLLALLAVVGVVALVLLCLFLVRLCKLMKGINGMLEENREDLRKTISSVPALTEKVNNSLEDVNVISSTARDVVEDTGKFVESLVTPEGGGNILSVVINVAKLIKSLMKK